MSNTNNKLSGERLSFYKLFCEKQYRISIPIIQRDYAQGRQTKKEIRDIFLDALAEYLEEGEPNRDLDFIYGSLHKADGITYFIPLDGQQRLTTLFLLHWYLCQISDNTEKKEEYKSYLLKDGKSTFTYETRSSSSDFCNALMAHDINFKKLKENILSKTIRDKSWFFLSWEYDPTIQSMLVMIDAIHGRFKGKKKYFERLIDIKRPVITFLFLDLKDFKLTDDLYIKMNSRGKQLTPFENFKAKFEQHLKKIPTKREFNLEYKGSVKAVSLKEYFSHNIDTKWANLFWNYRGINCEDDELQVEEGSKDLFDKELINFIRVIFASQYAISNHKDDNLEFLLDTDASKDREDYDENITYYKYIELDAITEKSILFLVDAFDVLVDECNEIKNHLSKNYEFYFAEDNVFRKALRHRLNYGERVLFHAYIKFLIKNKNDRTGIDQWMRVIHNLTNNSNVDGVDDVSNAMKSVEKLLPISNDILSFLREKQAISFFSRNQILEEKIKAHLMRKNDNWKKKIINTEKNDCFDGQIGFILEFSGIVDYYEKKANCNWTEQENKKYFNSFMEYADKAIAVFKNKESYDNRFVWERAVMTKGDYLLDGPYCRKNFLSTESNKRDYSWKRLLQLQLKIDNDKDLLSKRLFVKEVFDDDSFDKNDLKNSLKKMCKPKTNTWRDYFIACPDIIEYCKQGWIRFMDENDIILITKYKMSSNHAEMYTYYLWKKQIEPRIKEFISFNEARYSEVTGEEETYIILGKFCHKKINYEVNIYYCNYDNLPNPYEIKFRKSEGKNKPNEYGDDIKNVLEKLNFEWNTEYEGYFFTSKDGDTLITKLEKLNKEIQKL